MASSPDCHFAESLQRWAKSSDDALERYMKNLKDANDAARKEFTEASVRHDRMTRTNRSVIGAKVEQQSPEKTKIPKAASWKWTHGGIPGQGAIRYVAIPFMCTPEMFAQYQSGQFIPYPSAHFMPYQNGHFIPNLFMNSGTTVPDCKRKKL
ncbi:hypothetical protein QR680_012347 [Steinernema hermaphroditum]|uniref:Uncharacterized protein n=1 Tax=Steinernema hermaphroditum TaxID=289476 RepID=A0AA39M0L5_9BILA|nr:hypothetical protein QR680_012347 [Steinernema hermaphroditum]